MEYMESCNKWKCLEIAAEYGNCKNTVRMEYDGNMDILCKMDNDGKDNRNGYLGKMDKFGNDG